MKIRQIEVCNWRSIKKLDARFEDLAIFIGQNNHGKSNVLSALLFFLGEIKHQDLDFNDGSDALHVEVVFSDLNEAEQAKFNKYVDGKGAIRVRKTAMKGGSAFYKGYVQSPVDDRFKEENAANYTSREEAQKLPFYESLPDKGRLTKAMIVEAQQKYVEDNEVETTYQLQESDFLGYKSVAKSALGEVFFIPAVRDASDDLSTKEAAAFGKLYSFVVNAIASTNDEWRSARSNLENLFGLLNKHTAEGRVNEARPRELTDFENEIGNELLSWGANIDVEVSAPSIEDFFKANTAVWVDDGVRTDVKRKGHGLQRALIFALMKVVAARLLSAKEGEVSSSFFILEEPELYLHPQAQRTLFETLVKLSEAGSQVFICTHSSALIDIEKYSSICIVRKDSEAVGTKIKQYTEELFPGDDKKLFNMSHWINPDRSELFFASKVLLLEGDTEKTIIPYLAKKVGVFDHCVTLINCGSKNSIPLYAKLLNSFGIKYVAVYDKDHQGHKNDQQRGAADAATRRVQEGVDTQFGSFIEMNNDLEEELGFQAGVSSKPYEAILKISEQTFQLSPSLEQKIRNMYTL